MDVVKGDLAAFTLATESDELTNIYNKFAVYS
jgi:hypothetical protein